MAAHWIEFSLGEGVVFFENFKYYGPKILLHTIYCYAMKPNPLLYFQRQTKLKLELDCARRKRDDEMRPVIDQKHALDVIKQKHQATADELAKYTQNTVKLHEELAAKHKQARGGGLKKFHWDLEKKLLGIKCSYTIVVFLTGRRDFLSFGVLFDFCKNIYRFAWIFGVENGG